MTTNQFQETPTSYMSCEQAIVRGNLTVGGAISVPLAPQPPFVTPTVVKRRFARPTGNDDTGDGSLANPYASLMRIVRDPPINGPASESWDLDVTGLNHATPVDFELPAWKAPDAFDDTPTDPNFPTRRFVNIIATPRLMASISVADATITQPGDLDVGGFPASGITPINAAGVPAGYSFDPLTGNLTLHLLVARASWAANALKGKALTDLDATLAGNATILASTNTSLTFGNSVAPTGVLSIKEPSAAFQVSSSTSPNTNRGGLNVYNADAVAFSGIKVTVAAGNFGLSWVGNGSATAQLCELQAPNFSSWNMGQNQIFACWIYGARVRFQGINTVQRTLIELIPAFNVFSPTQLHVRHSLITGCGVINAARAVFAGTNPTSLVPADLLFIEQSTVRNGTSHGVQFNGGRMRLFAVDLAANAGDGLNCQAGPGYGEVLRSGSSAPNGSAGVRVPDPIGVKVDTLTSANATPLTGAAGDMVIGDFAARTWADFIAAIPPSGHPRFNEYNITLAAATGATGTGARLWQ